MKVVGDDTGKPVSPSRRMNQCLRASEKVRQSSRKARLAFKKKSDTLFLLLVSLFDFSSKLCVCIHRPHGKVLGPASC